MLNKFRKRGSLNLIKFDLYKEKLIWITETRGRTRHQGHRKTDSHLEGDSRNEGNWISKEELVQEEAQSLIVTSWSSLTGYRMKYLRVILRWFTRYTTKFYWNTTIFKYAFYSGILWKILFSENFFPINISYLTKESSLLRNRWTSKVHQCLNSTEHCYFQKIFLQSNSSHQNCYLKFACIFFYPGEKTTYLALVPIYYYYL